MSLKTMNENLVNKNKNKQFGFTLIEVLVAVVVFSFGLLGIAGMMTISVKNNHNGYLRTQANFLVENMVDRMRANPAALWADAYNIPVATGAALCDLANPCTFAELAVFDVQTWADELTRSLPNGTGTIVCSTTEIIPPGISTPNAPSIWFPAPPYPGVCAVTATWDESNRESATDSQQVVLVAQP